MGVGGPWRVSMDELMDKNLPYFVGGNLGERWMLAWRSVACDLWNVHFAKQSVRKVPACWQWTDANRHFFVYRQELETFTSAVRPTFLRTKSSPFHHVHQDKYSKFIRLWSDSIRNGIITIAHRNVHWLARLAPDQYTIIIPASLIATDKGSAGSLSMYWTTDLLIDYAANTLMETSSMSNMTASDHVRRLSPVCVSCKCSCRLFHL